MKPLTHEWVKKAEGDFISAQREYRARKHPNYDSACFHAQQCVEKYLKARLVEAEAPFSKTHDLTYLVSLLSSVEPFLSAYLQQLRELTDYAVEFRYPGESAEKEEAKSAVKTCKEIRKLMRQRLGLENA
ncbi:MAG: DNA-binding protein [Chloroflexi bacterium]|nr:MAG: DNA-binding protein [Chloroflexota bacterium]